MKKEFHKSDNKEFTYEDLKAKVIFDCYQIK